MTAVLRIGLAILAVVELLVGGWLQFWPRHFYDNFPTVDATPPFSEHFARDFGGATLGIGVILACAAIVPRTVLVVPVLLGLTVFAVPHAVFHLVHLHHVAPAEQAFAVLSTSGTAVVASAMLVLALVRHRRMPNGKSSTG